MGIFATIGQLLKALNFFLSLWREKDKKKAEAKKKVMTKVVDAFKQTDKKERASRLNRALDDANRL
ncbi:MAG: hypothetical protein ACXABY_30725 [Candidatus Thorarchaeota archaeon]|jgi:hypothetical protein